MQASKVFFSHSHKDQLIARALVDLLEQAGVNRNSIIASSAPKAQLPTGSPLYGEIRSALSDKDTFVILLLSDNFYSSTATLIRISKKITHALILNIRTWVIFQLYGFTPSLPGSFGYLLHDLHRCSEA